MCHTVDTLASECWWYFFLWFLEWVPFLQWSQFPSWCDIEHTAVTIAPNWEWSFSCGSQGLDSEQYSCFSDHEWDWSHVMCCPGVTFVIQWIHWRWNADDVFSCYSWAHVSNELRFRSYHNVAGFYVISRFDVTLNIGLWTWAVIHLIWCLTQWLQFANDVHFSRLHLHNLVRKLFLWFFTNSIIERYDSFLAFNSTETVGPWKPLTDRNFGETSAWADP